MTTTKNTHDQKPLLEAYSSSSRFCESDSCVGDSATPLETLHSGRNCTAKTSIIAPCKCHYNKAAADFPAALPKTEPDMSPVPPG